MRLLPAALGALAALGSACTPNGDRAVGAAGYPAVVYQPCCSGSEPTARAGDWGLFCEEPACYGPGERNQGAEGYPEVLYQPCCNEAAAVPRDGEWGRFCPGGSGGGGDGGDGGGDKICFENGERQYGEIGYPSVDYKPYCDVNARAAPKANDWGKFCTVPDVTGCYANGERAAGQEFFPAVDFKPCCDLSATLVTVEGDWGEFCAAPNTTITVAPPVVGVLGEGEFCQTSGSGLCAAGLICHGFSCFKGNCRFLCAPVLNEGEKCSSATASGPAPAVGEGALIDGGTRELCAEGLSCQWRGEGETLDDGARTRRDYFCHPLPTNGECFATIETRSGCFLGVECGADGTEIPFGRCPVL